MSFSIKTAISECKSIEEFFCEWKVGSGDLIITNEYILKPYCTNIPCDTLFQENFGKGEPTDEMIDAMLSQVNGKNYKRIIAIGGGTVIDIAKLFVFGDDLSCSEIFEKGASLSKVRNFIAIPTTCGTGSEVTNISIVSFLKKNTKVGLAIPALFPDEAVLIGALLGSMPYEVFATSSIDALIHAVESYVSPKASMFTQALGKEAITLILTGYRKLVSIGAKNTLPEDMSDFLAASTMAGAAFGNAGCAAVHALSYPIGAIYHVPHGKANYLMFSSVFAAYRKKGANLSALESVIANAIDCATADVWDKLFELVDNVLPREPLSSLGIDVDTCHNMAASVIQNQQRLLINNPLPLLEDEIFEIYKSCL